MKSKEYFEQLDGDCDSCKIKEFCSAYGAIPTQWGIPDGKCTMLSKEESEMDIDDLLIKALDSDKKYNESLHKEELKQEAIKNKKEEIQEKRRATLWKNREKNKKRAIERKEKRRKEKLQSLINAIKGVGEIMKDCGLTLMK